jgi:hypothetical protein
MRSFAELLEQAIRSYLNRTVEALQVIEELITLAGEIHEADRKAFQHISYSPSFFAKRFLSNPTINSPSISMIGTLTRPVRLTSSAIFL